MYDPHDPFLILLLCDFEPGFGPRMGKMVVDNDWYQKAIDLASERWEIPLSTIDRAKVAFRAAYALENAFFIDQELFIAKYIDRFMETFTLIKNSSAHRHFGKIMATLLHTQRLKPTIEQASFIAETTAQWLADPKSRVAVKIWALEILNLLAPQVEWVNELLPDAIGLLSINPTPGIRVRLRRMHTK